MKAYHNNTELKQTMVDEAIKHRNADQLAQNFGYGKTEGDEFRGCAVGCTLHSLEVRLGKSVSYNDHSAYERELGIPRILARLEDGIFEGLPKNEAQTWPQRFLEAIPVGADLSGVGDKFLYWLLADRIDGVIKYAKKDSTKKAIQDVADLYAKKIAGETITRDQWLAVRSAAAADAAAAYADAADAAYADAAAADAAYAAADAAYAAADAAYAAAADADAAAYAAADVDADVDADADAYAADAYAADADAAAAAADAAADAAAAAYADAYAAAADADARKKARVKQSEKLLELMANAPVELAAK